MLLQDQHPLNRHITVAVLGEANVGKSCLINYLLGSDLSIVTPLPQTTRNKIHCIFTIDRTEIILIDTPGLHSSRQEINKRFNQQARESILGADLSLLLLDLSRELLPQIQMFQSFFPTPPPNLWIIFTKSDLLFQPEDSEKIVRYADNLNTMVTEVLPELSKSFVVSSKRGDNLHDLTAAIVDAAAPGPHLYPGGEVSNKSERFFVCEYIREQAFELLRNEVPYQIAVIINEYQKINTHFHISASIIVNRPSQRGIVVGSGGKIIKEIGVRSRPKIEAMLGGNVFLNLHVKVAPRWFKNNFILEELGLPRAADSARVWHNKKGKST